MGAEMMEMKNLDDVLDDHVRKYLLPKIMYAVKQAKNGDPLKDFLDVEDEIEAFDLLVKIGNALGIKAERK